jgi:hypothetical protein
MNKAKGTAIRYVRAAALCLMFMALADGVSFAQGPAPQLAPGGAPSAAAPAPEPQSPAQQPAVQLPPPPVEQKPGLIETFGRWFDESVNSMNKGLKSTLGAGADTTKSAAEAASEVAKGAAEAAGAVGRLGTSRVVSGQAVCAIAPNGAPDCRVAAESLCKANGFSTGSSVDFVTAEKCPAQTFVAGRRASGECVTEHTVTRALCQ